jgi:hypothetical protein
LCARDGALEPARERRVDEGEVVRRGRAAASHVFEQGAKSVLLRGRGERDARDARRERRHERVPVGAQMCEIVSVEARAVERFDGVEQET